MPLCETLTRKRFQRTLQTAFLAETKQKKRAKRKRKSRRRRSPSLGVEAEAETEDAMTGNGIGLIGHDLVDVVPTTKGEKLRDEEGL